MSRIRTRRVAYAVAVLAVGLLVVWWGRYSDQLARPDRPFRDLPAVLDHNMYARSGWEVETPPLLPGPYREDLKSGHGMLGRGDTGQKMTTRVLGEARQVLEEVTLTARPDCDLMVLGLETEAGERTLAVIKRSRLPGQGN